MSELYGVCVYLYIKNECVYYICENHLASRIFIIHYSICCCPASASAAAVSAIVQYESTHTYPCQHNINKKIYCMLNKKFYHVYQAFVSTALSKVESGTELNPNEITENEIK